jgi:hypothetical protein
MNALHGSRVRNNSHFAHASFVATFEAEDIGHRGPCVVQGPVDGCFLV